TLSNGDVAQNVRVVADKHSVAQCGMPFSGTLSSTTKRHAMVERHVIADDCGLSDDHADAVIDKQSSTDLRLGMDLNSRPETRKLRQHTRQKSPAIRPQPVMDAMGPHCVQARIAKQYHCFRGGRSVALEYAPNIFADQPNKIHKSGLIVTLPLRVAAATGPP